MNWLWCLHDIVESRNFGRIGSAVKLDLTNASGMACFASHICIYAMHRCYSLSILLRRT